MVKEVWRYPPGKIQVMWKMDFRTTIHFYGEKKKNSHKLLWHSTPKDFCSQNVSLQIPLYYGQFVWTLKWVQRTWTPQLCDVDTLLYPFTVPFLRSCHLSGCRYYQTFVYRWELWRLFWAIRQIAYVCRAQNNGRSTDNVRPDRGLDRSNSHLAGHFDRSFLDANLLNIFHTVAALMRFAL